jgi:hypothetical protein
VTVPAERPLGLAVVAALEAELGANLAGYGRKPSGGGWQTSGTPTPATPFKGYAVVYVGQTTPGAGTAASAVEDGLQGFQVTAHGSTAEQADAIRDRCRAALLGVRLTLTGRACDPIEFSDGQNTLPDRDVTPTVYFAADRYVVATYPD